MVERELGGLKAEADAFRNIRELKALGSEVISGAWFSPFRETAML